jgi:ankyrin repeat protein
MRVLGIFCLASTVVWAGDGARDAAVKGIALIQASQKTWTQACDSCYQQLLPPLAFRTAREHGLTVNEDLAHASAASAFKILADVDRAAQYTHIIDPALSDGYTLLGADAAGVRPSVSTAIYARLIAARQRADGHWDTLDVRPPQSYSTVSATAIASRALQIYGHSSLAAETKSRLERARNWLISAPVHSTEERVMQLYGISWMGGDREPVAKLRRAIQASQQKDGGWGYVEGRPSDAYSTGEALTVLAETDSSFKSSDPAWRRGIEFLLRTQAADGSWHVTSRVHPPAPVSPAYFETGYPYGHDQFVSAMGASWAIRALALSLPAVARASSQTVAEAAPASVEPWVETAIFGSAGELNGLLDKGLDVNSATKSGGTTLLMMAQPDLEKTKLLIGRGAKVNGRSKTRYSALMVAAQYPGSTATMQFLLDHGAEVRVPKGAGTPLFNASPFVIAAAAGNAAILPKLAKAGDNIESKMVLQGTFATTGLLMAVSFGDVEATRATLDCGAKIDAPDADGVTALGWAAIGNVTPVAKLLIERGADVNHVDRFGMTALLYAASIDFGDASMIDVLLKAGASPAARTKEGLTAAALAKKYGHTLLFKSLATGP